MKNCNIQSLTLIMLIAMAYAASLGRTTPDIQLREIIKQIEIENKNLEANTTLQNKTVPEILGHAGQCANKTLCLAEKALRSLDVFTHSPLIRNLHLYNKGEKITCGKPSTSRQIKLHTLLKEIKKCAQHLLEEKK